MRSKLFRRMLGREFFALTLLSRGIRKLSSKRGLSLVEILVAELVRKTVPALNCGKNLLVEAVVCPTEIIDLRA